MSVLVASAGPPLVVTKMMSNTRKASIILKMSARKAAGSRSGRMMSRSRWAALAPSTAAASRRSVLSDFSPASRISASSGVHSQASVGVSEQAARTGQAELGERIAKHPVFGTEQRLEHQPDHQRRDGRRDKQKPQRDPVEPVVAPQQERDAKAEDELNRHRAEGEQERVDQSAVRGRVPPKAKIIVEPDEMTRGRSDQAVAIERV